MRGEHLHLQGILCKGWSCTHILVLCKFIRVFFKLSKSEIFIITVKGFFYFNN